jgi:hypothetical protein
MSSICKTLKVYFPKDTVELYSLDEGDQSLVIVSNKFDRLTMTERIEMVRSMGSGFEGQFSLFTPLEVKMNYPHRPEVQS